MTRKFIVCMVDPKDNSYDYETDGRWTDDFGTVYLWYLLGIEKVVFLDALSMELVMSMDNDELGVYLETIDVCDKNLW